MVASPITPPKPEELRVMRNSFAIRGPLHDRCL
jgi:hypothetical protein